MFKSSYIILKFVAVLSNHSETSIGCSSAQPNEGEIQRFSEYLPNMKVNRNFTNISLQNLSINCPPTHNP